MYIVIMPHHNRVKSFSVNVKDRRSHEIEVYKIGDKFPMYGVRIDRLYTERIFRTVKEAEDYGLEKIGASRFDIGWCFEPKK